MEPPNRKHILAIHAAAGAAAFLVILSFQTATIIAETLAVPAFIAAVKTGIVFGLLVLIPMMAVAGATGRRLVSPSPGASAMRKLRRLALAASNGVLVLVPSATWKARAGMLDAPFFAVQALELAAGLVNLILIGLNMRDGFAMTGRFRRRPIVTRSPRQARLAAAITTSTAAWLFLFKRTRLLGRQRFQIFRDRLAIRLRQFGGVPDDLGHGAAHRIAIGSKAAGQQFDDILLRPLADSRGVRGDVGDLALAFPGSGPPARVRQRRWAPRKLRGEWHSAQ